MLRITVVSQNPQEAMLKVEGWVSGVDVDLLAREAEHWLPEVQRLVVDLTGVQFIDEAGIALLLSWSENPPILRGGSPFIRALLEANGLA